MKVNWNKKYTTYAIYAGIVSAAIIFCIFLGIYIKDIWGWVKKIVDVFIPLIYGVIIAYMLNPLLRLFEKTVFRKIKHRMAKRGFGVALTYIVFLSALSLLVYAIVPQLGTSFRELEGNLAKYSQSIQDWLSDISAQAGFLADIVRQLEKHVDFSFLSASISEIIDIAYNLVVKFSPHIIGFLQSFAEQVLNIIIGLIFAGYLLCSKELIFAQINKLMHVLFKKQRIEKIKVGVTYADKTFGKYLIGVFLDAISVGSITALGMIIFNMPYIPLISVIIACTNIIPIFGPFIGGIPSFLIIFISDPLKALLFVGMIFIIQQIDGNFIAPRIYGSTTGLPALYVIIAITVMGGLFGVVGMIIGVPVFAILGGVIASKTNQRLRKRKAEIEEGARMTKDGYTEKDYEGFDEFEDDYSGRPFMTDDSDIALKERISPSVSADEGKNNSEVDKK